MEIPNSNMEITGPIKLICLFMNESDRGNHV
jgi:hypothetical protein